MGNRKTFYILYVSQILPISKKCAGHFCRETANKDEQFNETKTMIFNLNCLKGTVVNRTLLYLCREDHLKLRLKFRPLWKTM